MFLRRIEVANIRSLRKLDLDFTSDGQVRRWTMLIGENGTGKSSLLRAIAMVLAGSEALPDLLGNDPDSWITNGASQARIGAEVETQDGQSRTFSLELRRGSGVATIIKDNDANLQALDAALAHSSRNYPLIGYGVSRRFSAQPSTATIAHELFRNPRGRSVATLFSADAELQSLSSWAMDLDYRSGRGALKVIAEALDGLLPDVRFLRIDRQRRRLLFRTIDGEVPLSQVSDGYQNVTAWVGDLLFRITDTFKNYKNPLSARGVLIIDEIDLHLHPAWQRQLREFLDARLPNFQIIATTHSALTAQQAGPGELHYLKREGARKRAVLHTYDGDPQKLMTHQLLLSDVFGLASLNSPQIEEQQQRYRRLKEKKSRSAAERSELHGLAETLRDVPDWTRVTSHDRKTLSVLRHIEKELAAAPQGAARPAARRRPAPTAATRRRPATK
jgi:predicted ATP-binding protein involved in virulence